MKVSVDRRYTVCRKLGLRKIICHVVELDDKSAFEVLLTEICKENVLILSKRQEPLESISVTVVRGPTELAFKISKSAEYICKRLSLLELRELLKRVFVMIECGCVTSIFIPSLIEFAHNTLPRALWIFNDTISRPFV